MFFFQAEDGIRDLTVTGVQTCALPISSLGQEDWPAQKLYEQLYCARGEMENRIKEQLSLFADRLSTEALRSNQLRLYFSSLAYVLVEALRRVGFGCAALGGDPVGTRPV